LPPIMALEKEYDPKRIEAEVFDYWERSGAYRELKARLSRGPKFYFLDGPPFPSSGIPHIGTCWNKVLKDIVIRYKRHRGYNVRDQPGYDCHGLPIEIAVEKKFGFQTKKDIEKFGVDRFVEECKRLAEENSANMSKEFKNLGVWMDWESPYMTHSNRYIESCWWAIKRAHERGLLEHGKKVVHWCPRCETVLSDYEVTEYRMMRDPSIYVKFPLRGAEGEHILIWTTTPWTLPSNVGVMVHPDFEYAKVKSGGEVLIMAKERVEPVFSMAGREYEIIEVLKGEELEGLEYLTPLLEEVPALQGLRGAHRVVLSEEFVTLSEGTGCVHMATGHGEEDFIVGERAGLPMVMFVDDEGRFSKGAGKYEGLEVRESNKVIIEDLRRRGLLFFEEWVEHKYPVCWRCKTPIILRATDQWFIRVSSLRDEMLQESSKATWIPEWAGMNAFGDWLRGAKDWVISRQRYWGTPMPIWACDSCGRIEVIGSAEELSRKAPGAGSLRDYHVPWVDAFRWRCECGGEMRRIRDVLVCWFDSGMAPYASLGLPREESEGRSWWPVDFIVEGRDQISGWFYSLLRTGVFLSDRAPFKTVLMHGFMLDERGREMHKSLGNYVTPGEAVERVGRDSLRLYVAQHTIWEDLKFSWRGLEEVRGDLNVIWNTFVFATTYMALDGFKPGEWPIGRLKGHLRLEDRWILSKEQRLIKEVTDAMEGYRLHEAARAIRRFLIEDLSRNYVRMVRKRAWREGDDPDKLAMYAVLYKVLSDSLILMAPFLPFLSERIFLSSFKGALGNEASVHMLPWPTPDEGLIDPSAEGAIEAAQEALSAAARARMRAGIKLRQPLRAMALAPRSEELRERLRLAERVLLEQGNVQSLEFVEPGRSFGEGWISEPFDGGEVFLDVRLTERELAEGLARDLVRRLQQMRKEMDLRVDDYVDVWISGPRDKVEMIRGESEYIRQEVRARDLRIIAEGEVRAEYVRDWEINGERYTLGIALAA
jgi:isoleucyl-tRNA synthetase